jgi:hypothetical protein
MTFILQKPSLLAARQPSRAAISRVLLAAALIAGFSANASATMVRLAGHSQETLEACLGGAPTCLINFSQVPANKQLIVTNAVCRISTSLATTGFVYVVVGKRNPSGNTNPLPPWSYLKPALTGIDSYNRFYVADGQILHLYDSGETPRIWAYPVGQGANIARLTCTISGTLQKRPAP